MIGIEETIWSNAFNQELPNALAKKYGFGIPLVAACWHVAIFRSGDIATPQPTFEEAMAMYNEVRGTVEHEKLRIQKELLGAVIERLKGRLEQLHRSSLESAFENLHNEPVRRELRQLVTEFRKTLGT